MIRDREEWRIGGRRVDRRAYRIESRAGWVTVKPRSMAVLEYLVRHAGQVCSRSDIMDAVWGRAEVTEDVLSQAIRELRGAFDEDARKPAVIETIPRGGYRLIATVDMPGEKRSHVAILSAAALLAVAVVAAAAWWWFDSSEATRKKPVVAVLPFEDPQGGSGYIADGIVDEITARIARLPALAVVARTSAFQFRDSPENIEAIAMALDADHLFEGRVYRENGRLRIHVQLVDSEGLHEWSRTFDESAHRLLPLFRRVGTHVATQLGGRSGQGAADGVESGLPEVSQPAFVEYLRAERMRRDNPQAARAHYPDASVAHYHEAVRLDPEFAAAWAGLAAATFQRATAPRRAHAAPEQAERLLAESRKAVDRALALQADNARALTVKAALAARANDWLSADQSYRKALRSSHSEAEILQPYAAFLYEAGYTSRALTFSRRALELDPLSAFAARLVAIGWWTQGKYETAGRYIELAGELQGAPAAVMKAHLLVAQKRYAAAANALEGADWYDFARRQEWAPSVWAALQGQGPVAKAQRLLQNADSAGQLEPVTGAITYTYLDLTEQALDMLNRSGPFDVLWSPAFSAVRSNPAFSEVMREHGVVELWRAQGPPDQCERVDQSFRCR